MTMQYLVRCVLPQEMAVREQLFQASDEDALRADLEKQGVVILHVRKQSQIRRGYRNAEFGLLCREVVTLIRAGMTVVEAVDTLAAARDAGPERGLIHALRERLQTGQALSQALSAEESTPAVLIAAVKAGERTSNLADSLADYLRFDELLQRLRRKVISAAIYPSLVAGLGLAISLFLLIVVMPSFSRMYTNLRGRATGFSAWVIDLSQWVTQNRGMTVMLLVVASLGLIWFIRSGAARRVAVDVAWAVPWLRYRVEDFQLAMLYQALALLLRGGYPVAEAMSIAGSAALGHRQARAIDQARAHIIQGSRVSYALSSSGLCDEVARRLLAAAERNGDFHTAADVVASIYGERFELFVERMTRIVEPVLLLAVAVMVGGIVVSMYMPVFDIATRLR